MSNSLEDVNPTVKVVLIGRDDLRALKILPVALGSLLEMTDILEEIFAEFFAMSVNGEGERIHVSDIDLAKFVMGKIKKNILKILSYVVSGDEKPDELAKEVTLPQTAEIVDIIFEANYAETEKKLKEGILEKVLKAKEEVQKSIPSEKSLQQSADTTK